VACVLRLSFGSVARVRACPARLAPLRVLRLFVCGGHHVREAYRPRWLTALRRLRSSGALGRPMPGLRLARAGLLDHFSATIPGEPSALREEFPGFAQRPIVNLDLPPNPPTRGPPPPPPPHPQRKSPTKEKPGRPPDRAPVPSPTTPHRPPRDRFTCPAARPPGLILNLIQGKLGPRSHRWSPSNSRRTIRMTRSPVLFFFLLFFFFFFVSLYIPCAPRSAYRRGCSGGAAHGDNIEKPLSLDQSQSTGLSRRQMSLFKRDLNCVTQALLTPRDAPAARARAAAADRNCPSWISHGVRISVPPHSPSATAFNSGIRPERRAQDSASSAARRDARGCTGRHHLIILIRRARVARGRRILRELCGLSAALGAMKKRKTTWLLCRSGNLMRRPMTRGSFVGWRQI